MIDNSFGLGAFDAEYETIKVQGRRETVPDGKYTIVVSDTVLDKDPAGSPRFTLFLEVQEGDHAGTVLAHDSIFSGDSRRLEFHKKAMLGLGMGHVRPSELQNDGVRSSFIGLRAEVSCVTKTGSKGGSFFNVYINRRLDSPAQPTRPAAPAPPKVAGSIQPAKQSALAAQSALDDGLPF